MNDSFERLIYALPSIRGKELRELFKGTAIEKEFLHICDPEEVDAEALTWGGSIDLAAGLNGYPEPGNLPVGSRLLFFFVGW
jgi:hypothetical protein